MAKLDILEKILIERGRIVTYAQLRDQFRHYKNINNKINMLVKQGWLVNLRRGIYFITKLGSRGFTSISNYLIANTIGPDSFVSFEAALKHHGLFDQGIRKYRSISKNQYLSKELEGIRYEYIKVTKQSYFGYEEVKVDGGKAKIAIKERALLDLVEYRRTISSVSLALEKLVSHFNEFDFNILVQYLNSYSKVTKKTFGLFLDLLKKDSHKVANLLKDDNSTSCLLNDSSKFSSKWRLYYDSILEEQII